MFVIAHRGANRYAPQNTLEAFRKAAELGADGVETDVRVTKDGHLVLCHNAGISGTSNGKGRISQLELSDLGHFDFGSWFGSKYHGTKIPTLDAFLQLMKESGMKIINIEVKPVAHGSLDFVGQIIDRAKEYGLADRLLISSFDENILKSVRDADPDIRTGYLYPAIGDIFFRRVKNPVEKAVKGQFSYILPQYSYATKGIVKRAHDFGIKVAVWTVNRIELVEKLRDAGVDGIITDYPDLIKNKLESL